MSNEDHSDYIETLHRRKARQSLTDDQEILLTRLGYEGPWNLSVPEATALINAHKAKEPATKRQVGYLIDLGYEGDPDDLSKARASALITELTSKQSTRR